MLVPVQSILVPIVDKVSYDTITYAKMLSEAYSKPLCILYFNTKLKDELLSLEVPLIFSSNSLVETVASTVTKYDSLMVVWSAELPYTTLRKSLLCCRDLRIPYLYIPNGDFSVSKVVLPIGFLIEEREKATWGRSFYRAFDSQIILVQPNDKGSRSKKNLAYVSDFFSKVKIPHTVSFGRKSSFNIEKECLSNFKDVADLMLVTASREYGLDDQFFGPKELRLIRKSSYPLMLLNPRDDLYVLCGD